MTGKERVLAALCGKEVEQLPVIPLVLAAAAKLQGRRVKDYIVDGEIMARCQIELWQKLGSDGIFVGADNSLEAEALGTKLYYPEDEYPYLVEPFLENIRQQDKLVFPDIPKCGRMVESIKACRIIKEEVGEGAAVIAKVVGPLTIAGQLLGLEKLLLAMADYPEEVTRLVNFTSQVSAEFALKLADNGADIIMLFDPVASPAVVPLTIFMKFALPCYKMIFGQLKKANVQGRWIQLAGPLNKLPNIFKELEVNLVSLDFQGDFRQVRQILPDVCLIGNIKPMLFQTGSFADIQGTAMQSLRRISSLKGIILSSSCEIPLDAPMENIRALVKVRELSGVSI